MAELTSVGVALLLALWADLRPPKVDEDGRVTRSGLVCLGGRHGNILVRALGYDTPDDAREALNQASAVCHDGGLAIDTLIPDHLGFVTRRRHP